MASFASLSAIAFAAAPAVGVTPPGSAYPTRAVLEEYGQVCQTGSPELESPQLLQLWRETALAKGWVRVDHAPPPGTDFKTTAAFRAYHSIFALGYQLLFPQLVAGSSPRMERQVFSKSVHGRNVLLSLLAIGWGEDRVVDECRLFDPLGDGVATNPITRAAVEQWVGRRVRQFRASYHGKNYSWDQPSGLQSVGVHFGSGGKPGPRLGARYDPYALYGLLLRRNVSRRTEIVVT
jgi:hypothetical protein